MSIELHCKRCGRLFVPSADAITLGPPHYWFCNWCRPAPTAGEKPEVLG